MELAGDQQPWFLQSSRPVYLPPHDALKKSQEEFDEFIRHDLSSLHKGEIPVSPPVKGDTTMTDTTQSDSFTVVTESTSAEIREGIHGLDVDEFKADKPVDPSQDTSTEQAREKHPFMEGLQKYDSNEPTRSLENMMHTENGDLAYRSSNDALVDLFSELEDVVSGPRLLELLNSAWKADPLATLKIIFNSRSIHLGKSSRNTFYRCAGWLALKHPHTLVANLRWLSRPVIEKKARKEGEEDIVFVDEKDEKDHTKFDVRHGVAHGYWKDLLNILALAANKQLHVLADPRDVLNSKNPGIIRGKSIKKSKDRSSRRGGMSSRGRGRGNSSGGRITSVPAVAPPTVPPAGGNQNKKGRVHSPLPQWRRGRGWPPLLHVPAFPSGPFPPGPPPPSFPPGFPSNFLSYQADQSDNNSWFNPYAVLPESTGDDDVSESSEEESQVGDANEEETIAAPPEVPQTASKHPDFHVARRETRETRHQVITKIFNDNPVYRALHLTVARLFAEQLQSDLSALRSPDHKAKRSISPCGKWAPSDNRFHDKYTFIVSSIAEILYPRESLDAIEPTDDREKYLRYAREEYRKDMSALRKHLEIVERDITAKTYNKIKYDRVPSLAMDSYAKLFIERDLDRFEKYIDQVAQGKADISGATLMPSTLIYKVEGCAAHQPLTEEEKSKLHPSKLVERKAQEIEAKVLDGQWNTLVQRIKDSGALDSSIAVCDVSGSMHSPVFPDKTSPMHSAIGLSMLLAEVTKPPFGGAFITFSRIPMVQKIDLSETLAEKYRSMSRAHWGMNTDFEAVFSKLILPMAVKNKLKQEDMVKRVFVFSDMQFDLAGNTSAWSTSYERIKAEFEQAGYEIPELIFWNLAGGRAGWTGHGDPIAPKPVTSTDTGTSLVSGYSQGMLKVFLENGSFEGEEEEESEDEVLVSKDDDDVVTAEAPKKKKAKMDPIRTVRKAIGHKAYDMLKVVD